MSGSPSEWNRPFNRTGPKTKEKAPPNPPARRLPVPAGLPPAKATAGVGESHRMRKPLDVLNKLAGVALKRFK